MPRLDTRRRTAAPLVAAAVEACEPRQLFSFVAPAFADRIGLGGVVDYNTTFEDNFNGTSIDKSKWQVRNGHRWRAYRDAPISTFSYTDETPIQVANGEMALIAHNDPVTGQLKGAFLQTGRHFDDQSKNSPVPPATLTPGYSGDFEQTYGYWESRARFDSLPGMWSAFWVHSYRMVEVRDDPSKAGRPDIFGTEMDVAEHQVMRRGSPSAHQVTSIIHANGYGSEHVSSGHYNDTSRLAPSRSGPHEYHVYGMLWTSSAVKFYIDGNLVGQTTDRSLISSAPQMALLSVEIGAGGSNEWGQGSNSSGYTPAGGYGSKATSRARATFDYVRVWKLMGQPTPTGNASAGGTVFVDADGDAIRDAGDAGRGGVTIYADYDKDGVRDPGEPAAVTDGNGNYRIDNIQPKRAIDLRIVPPAGAPLVAPESGKLSYVTFPGRYEQMRNFALARAGTTPTPTPIPTPMPTPTPPAAGTASAAGAVFVDADGDGFRDGGEAGRAGAVVWADVNGNSVRDGFERAATSAADGSYRIDGLAVGISTQIRLVWPAGFRQTAPGSGFYSFKPYAGQVNAACHFGVRSTTTATPPAPKPTPAPTGSASISSVVFVDADRDGVRDANEVGRAGAIVFIDANYNGFRDAGERYATTASNGTYSFSNLPLNTSVRVLLAGIAGFVPTQPGAGGYSFKTYANMFNTKTTFGIRPA